jgi:hypothetical protein
MQRCCIKQRFLAILIQTSRHRIGFLFNADKIFSPAFESSNVSAAPLLSASTSAKIVISRWLLLFTNAESIS